MGKRFLLDSNAVIDFLSGRFGNEAGAAFVKELVATGAIVSVVTKIETKGYSGFEGDEEKAVDLFLRHTQVLPLSDEIVEQTILLRKKYKLKLPDLIIAATAVESDLALVTRTLKTLERLTSSF